MDCDSARFYENINKIEAFGNIYIRQNDTLDLWGKYLEYDGDTRLAKVSNDVKLTDGKMTLSTDQLNYDMVDKVGYYTTGGDIVNGEDKLYSERGTYYSRSKEFFFKDSVKLTNPEYTMESDTLKYNTRTKLATFLGPTFIRSEENTIYCRYGWYNTDKEVSQFSKGAYIEGESNRLTADSMMYYRNTGLGEAFGNISMVDTTEQVAIYGEYGKYQRLEKLTMVTGSPRAIKNIDGDSLYFRADTFIDLADTLLGKKRRLIAYRSVKLYKSDMQAISDSMEYNFTDSTIGFYTDPVLWTDSNQITGDTILVFRNQDGIERLEAYQNGYVIERDPNSLYNQIKGKHLEAFFIKGKIYKVDVDGNGQSIYYAREDSTKYSGVNDVLCGKMTINIDTFSRIRTIVFKNKPKAAFYPLEKFPKAKSRLNGFKWNAAVRPKISAFLN
jgi:lipopolysaccharide export system protein LptA